MSRLPVVSIIRDVISSIRKSRAYIIKTRATIKMSCIAEAFSPCGHTEIDDEKDYIKYGTKFAVCKVIKMFALSNYITTTQALY